MNSPKDYLTDREKLMEKIYSILYKKSRVDGIRLINEDEWPIDELSALLTSEVERVIGKDERHITDTKGEMNRTGNPTMDEIINTTQIEIDARNQLRMEQRKALSELKGGDIK